MTFIHNLMFLTLAIVASLMLVLSLLVFDISQTVLLAVYILLLPVVAVLFWPQYRHETPWGRQIAVWMLTALPLGLGLLLNDFSRPRMVVMADALVAGYIQDASDLAITYREMPIGTARFPLIMPNGEEASLARNWDYIEALEQRDAR